jgi:hypothetical protein
VAVVVPPGFEVEVVVVVKPLVVGVVVELVVVEAVVVVVVVAPPPPLENVMPAVTWSPPWSPKTRPHENPADVWAGVGGHGNRAASLTGELPTLSVEGHETRSELPHGGPGVGETMMNDVESVPPALVDASVAPEIPLQLTGTVWLMGAGKLTVG